MTGSIINAQTRQIDTSNRTDLSFIGKRGFETRPGVSGTGTPSWFIEIKKNGDVNFGFEQRNNATNKGTEGRYYVGRFQAYMKCVYKDLDNEV